MIDVRCVIKNNTDNEIYYMNQSCNGLDYYLILKPDSYSVSPLMNCNATWGMISKLNSQGSIKFKTQILKLRDSKPIENIGIDFRVTDKFIPFETLRKQPKIIEKVYRKKTEQKNIIWGNEE